MIRIFHMLAVFAISTLLASGSFAAYLFASGKLNAARLERIAAVLRGELDQLPTSQPSLGGPETHAPTSAPAHRTAEEIEQQRLRERIAGALADRGAADIDAKRELLEKALAHLITEQEAFEKGKAEWKATQQKLRQQGEDEGFKAEVDLVKKIPDAQAKEHVLATWSKHPADAVRLMKALGASKSAAILKQFKTPEETRVMHELLEQLRKQDIDKLTPGSGKTTDDATP